MHFKHHKLALALSVLMSGNAFAQHPSASIHQTLKMAIEKNPEVQASWHNFLSSGHEAKEIGAEQDTTVDFFADYSAQYRNTTINETYHGASARLSASKMLWDGGRLSHQAKSFEHTELVRYFELLDSIENTALEAYIAYQDVLRYRELAGLAQKSYDSHLEVYDKIAAGVKTGHTRRADLEQINGRLALAESNLLTEKANLHDVSARFLRIVGQVPAKILAPADLNTDTLPNTFDEVMTYAYNHNPSFHAAIRDIEAKLSQINASRAESRPRVDLNGFYNIQNYDDNTGEDNLNTAQQNAKIALEFRYNLYNGNRTSEAINKAQENMTRSKYIREKACIDMRQTLQIAYNDVKKVTEQLPILNQHRNSSDRVRTAFNDQFSINQRSLLDLLDTEIEFFQSSRAYANAHYDRNISVAKTLAEMGKLLKTLELSRGELPSLADLGTEPTKITPEITCPVETIPTMDLAPAEPKVVVAAEAITPKFVVPEETNKEGLTYRLEVFFEHNSSLINSQYANDIAELAQFMVEHPDTMVEIRGHASLEGSDKYNLWLSKRRANQVVKTLIKKHNIDPSRLSSVGYGESKPLINATTPEANQANRRIESNIKRK